jgi:hypothetical protein
MELGSDPGWLTDIVRACRFPITRRSRRAIGQIDCRSIRS